MLPSWILRDLHIQFTVLKVLKLIESDAISPEYEWLLNGAIINGETDDNFTASEFGEYTVRITETTGCIGSRELMFTINEAIDPFPDVDNIPNYISPNGDNINDTWVIPTQYVSGTNTEVMIMTSRGEIVLKTNDYLNNWPENDLNLTSVNQVFYYVITTTDNKTKKGSK